MKKTIIKSVISAIAVTTLSTGAFAADTAACLITKNNTNPFFVKMKEGAENLPWEDEAYSSTRKKRRNGKRKR